MKLRAYFMPRAPNKDIFRHPLYSIRLKRGGA